MPPPGHHEQQKVLPNVWTDEDVALGIPVLACRIPVQLMGKDGSRQIAALPWRNHINGIEILLITSRETKRWVIPKGWPMKGKTDSEAAAVEGLEEAGIRGHVSPATVWSFTYEKHKPNQKPRALEVVVYGFEVMEELESWPEQHERERQWFSQAEAATKVSDIGLRMIIEGFAPPLPGVVKPSWLDKILGWLGR